jgi:hypothetical protein
MVDLVGIWRLKSAYFVAQGTGDRLDFLGAEPFGRAVFEPGGRMIAILTSAACTRAAAATDMAALYKSMIAYTGMWSIDGEKFVTQVDGAWDRAGLGPNKSGTSYSTDARFRFVRRHSTIRHFPASRSSVTWTGKRKCECQ